MPWIVLVALLFVVVRAIFQSGIRRGNPMASTAKARQWREEFLRNQAAGQGAQAQGKGQRTPYEAPPRQNAPLQGDDIPPAEPSPWAQATTGEESLGSQPNAGMRGMDLRQMVIAREVLERRAPGPYRRR